MDTTPTWIQYILDKWNVEKWIKDRLKNMENCDEKTGNKPGDGDIRNN